MATMEAETRYALSGDVHIAYQVTGEGPFDLVLVPGYVTHMEKAALRNDVDVFFAANLAFHDRLVELAANSKLLATYRRLVNELRLFRRTNLAQGGALPNSAREHRHIVERIAARDVEGAGRALHEHVMASRERMHKSSRNGARARTAPTLERKLRRKSS